MFSFVLRYEIYYYTIKHNIDLVQGVSKINAANNFASYSYPIANLCQKNINMYEKCPYLFRISQNILHIRANVTSLVFF